MKRTYLAKRNAFLTRQSASWSVFALLFVCSLLFFRFITPNLFWHVLTPVFRVSDAIGVGSHTFFSAFGDAMVLTKKNEALTAHNFALANENRTLLKEVEEVKKLFDTSAAQGRKSGILASVVTRPPLSPYDTLVLSVGSDEGVMLGMEVFGEGGVPIGVVSGLLKDFSQATLFSAPGAVVYGWIGDKNVPLTLVGAGAGALTATISRDIGVKEGDTVFVPGPGMLPIGSVVQITDNPLSPGVTLHIMPATNLFSTAWVELRATGMTPMEFATSTQL